MILALTRTSGSLGNTGVPSGIAYTSPVKIKMTQIIKEFIAEFIQTF